MTGGLFRNTGLVPDDLTSRRRDVVPHKGAVAGMTQQHDGAERTGVEGAVPDTPADVVLPWTAGEPGGVGGGGDRGAGRPDGSEPSAPPAGGLWSAPSGSFPAAPPPRSRPAPTPSGQFPAAYPSGQFPAPPRPGQFPAGYSTGQFPAAPPSGSFASVPSGYESYAPPPSSRAGAVPPPPSWPAAGHTDYAPKPPDNRRTVVIGMCALVTVVALALTAFLVVNATGRTTAAPSQPAAVAPQNEDSPLTSSDPSPSYSSPSYSSPPTASSAPALPGSALVSLSSTAASSPSAATVQTLLDRHFGAINTVNYSQWTSTVTSDRVAQVSSSSFSQQYATSVDGNVVVSSITSTGSDSASVSLSFTSRQSLQNAPSDLRATCINWSSTWPVSSLSSGGAIGMPPKSATSKSAC